MKTWIITLIFKNGSTFAGREDGSLDKAKESAMRYARACGWGAPPVRIKAEELVAA